ncbi:MAG: hypothetical protein MPK62_06190 [Alphaproteobacteria bacterium]|nr:hypothetical protein [Alphaproteobacteria bacterium]MDA8030710.1 hypothetical protein [Alphaproteobacteria bacterium]
MAREDVVNAILSGIQKAHKDYYRMSGGLWMWHGPEYWVTTYVAKALWKICGDGTVVAEEGSSKMMKGAGRKQGRPSQIVRGKRFDIALYFANGEPRAPIEIKNQGSSEGVLKDVKRMLAALRESRLLFGAVAYCYSKEGGKQKNAQEKVKDYGKNLSEKAKSLAAKDGCSAESKICVSGDAADAWLAGCILLERKPGNKRG